MGEILLLDVGLVVLFVGSRAGPFDAPVAAQEVGFDNFVEEFAAVIAVESEHRKGQAFFDPLKAYAHFAAAITPERCQLSPTAMEVGECQAPEERSAAASSASATTSAAIADKALGLIDIKYEVLPFVIDVEAAMAKSPEES